MRTIALVAAKDAATTIGATVAALAALPGIDEVWVVDDGSSDDTSGAARAAGAQVLRLESNQGKGGALAAGVAAAPRADWYLLADADLGATAGGLAPLLASHDTELVIGVLPSAAGRGGFGGVKRFARAGIARACGVTLEAPLSGQRLVRGDVLRSLTLAPRFGVEVGMTIDAVRAGAAVREVPVAVDHRHTGRSLAGFRHRGRQGADILGALVPRLSSARRRAAAIVAIGVAVVMLLSALSWLTAPPRGAALPRADRVVLFAFDRLALSDLQRSDLPGLRGLVRDGAAGALSVRTTDRRSLGRRDGVERPSPLDAYASLGASARVRGVTSLAVRPGEAARGMDEARALARDDHAASLPGALGDALHAAGKRTALVGGAALVDGVRVAGFPAAAALADRDGRIDRVDVAAGLLEGATAAPGVRASIPAFVVAAATAMRAADVVIVDPAETTRAADAGADRTAALRRTDAILAGVRGVLPPDTVLIVVSPTPPGSDWELTPIVVFGAGTRGGTVSSPATRREGLSVLTDLAPTLLRCLGVRADASMTGSALRTASGAFSPAQLERLTDDGAVRGRFFLGAAVGYTVVALAFYLLLIAALLVGLGGAWSLGLRFGVLAAGAFPLALFLTGALQHWARVGGESPLVLVLVCAALAAVSMRARALGPLYWFAGAALAITAVDIAITGPIHTASLLGYSIATTGRFFGLPNASFSVFATSLLLVAAATAGGVRGATATRAVAGTVVLGAGCVVVAAPWLGNDIGGTLALLPVSAAVSWAFFGQRLTAQRTAIGAGLVALGVIGVLVLEAATGSTHLRRALGGGGSLRTTLSHRIDVNVGLLVDQWWGFLVFAVAVGSLVLLWRGKADGELPLATPLRAGVAGALVLSLLAFAVNDSGPVVSVLCLVVVAPVVARRAISGDRLRQSRR